MKIRNVALSMGLALTSFGAMAQTASKAKMDKYITNLMSKMTLDEKVGQLDLPSIGFDITGPILSKGVEGKIEKGLVGGVFNTYTPNAVRKLQDIAVKKSRLKIPLLFGYDVIHGHKTIFPIPLGLSSSWDMPLIEKTARAAADEASADGVNWVFSPMVDIARDPRWGRVAEGGGEDPYLGSAIARAMVHGYQGNDLTKSDAVLACVKHFALYGAVEAGRDYNTVDMSERKMYDVYFTPYKAAVQAGAGSVMSSFNDINGVPASANKWLLTDVLRKQWGFDGIVATDYTAVMELTKHGLGDDAQVGKASLVAGVDMDMVSEIFVTQLKKLVETKQLDVKYVNLACRRVLEAKYKLGLFDNPYNRVSEDRAAKEIMSAGKLALSKEAAEKSMVLLKNKNEVLPLKADQKIAFIGPFVQDQRDLIGCWSGAGDWKQATSFWDAAKTQYPDSKFTYAKGANIIEDETLLTKLNHNGAGIVPDTRSPQTMIDEAVEVAKKADVVVAFLGESVLMSGEAASKSNINIPANQRNLLRALKATGKPVVLVLMNGRPLTLQWEDDNIDGILETWFGGTKSGEAIADVLFGKYNPSGKLSMTFPRSVGQIPVYYNAKSTGRPFDEGQKYTTQYLDVANSPLYPFGYGLSYTSFSYSKITLSKASFKLTEKLQASVTITNTGKYDGEETPQLYIRDMVSEVTRPVRELKGFKKVFLKAGESKTVTFTISNDDLKFYDINMKYTSEPGDFKVFIGGTSQTANEADFKLLK